MYLDDLKAMLDAILLGRDKYVEFCWDGYGRLDKPLETRWSPKYLGGKPSDRETY